MTLSPLRLAIPRLGIAGLLLVTAAAVLGNRAVAGPITPEQLVISSSDKDAAASDDVKAAVEAFNANDLAKATELFEKAAAKNPAIPPAPVWIARMLLVSNNVARAQNYLDTAILKDPKEPELVLTLAEHNFRNGRITETKVLLDEATRLLEGFTASEDRKKNMQGRILQTRAFVANNQQQYDEERRLIDEWVKLEPENHLAQYRLGLAIFRANPGQEAYLALEQAFKLNDQLPPPGIIMMQLFEESKKHDKAKQWADYALQKRPKDPITHLAVANWSFNTGDLDGAMKEANRAAELDPEMLKAKIMRGVVSRYRRKLDEAEQYLEDARIAGPNDLDANDQLALVLIESKEEADRRRAVQLAEQNFKAYPNVPGARWTLMWTYFLESKVAEAESVMNQTLQAGMNPTPDALYYIARLLQFNRKQEQAKQFLEQALAVETNLFYHRPEAKQLLDQMSAKASSPKADAEEGNPEKPE